MSEVTAFRVGPVDVLRIAAIGVLSAMAVMFAVSALPGVVGRRGAVVMTGSMQPALNPGDVVVVGPQPAAALRPGQIVLFRDPGDRDRLVIHRFVRHQDDGSLVTKGDANRAPDTTAVRVSEVVGVAWVRVPWVGLAPLWFQQQAFGRLAGAALLLAALVGFVAAGSRSQPARPRADMRSARHCRT